MSQIVYMEGYERALLDVAELLNNASANGSRAHTYEELMDQLGALSDQNNHGRPAYDELLGAGK